jgi:AraC-like DNA-binding protein
LKTHNVNSKFIAKIDILLHLMKSETVEIKNHYIEMLSKLVESNFKHVYFGWERPISQHKYVFHPHPRLMFSLEGSSVLEISDCGTIRTVELKPGDVLFLVKGGWLSRTPENNSKLASVVFLEDFLRILTVDFDYDEVMGRLWYHTSGRVNKSMFFLLQTLTAVAYQKRSHKDELLLKTLYLQIADELRNDQPHQNTRSWHAYQRIINYLTDNYHQLINRESAAADLNINASHISRLFQQYSKESFSGMLKRMRMEHAVNILKNAKLNVKEVADECGFSSSDYFIKAFKQYFGTTPLGYRNRWK